MKVNPSDFLKELSFLSKVVNPKSTLPICRAVLFSDGELRTTDLDRTIIIRRECSFEAAVNIRTLRNVISALKDLECITITRAGETTIKVVSDLGTTIIGGFEPREFPKVPEYDLTNYAESLDSEVLRRANKFSGKDGLRPVMSGVFLGEDIVATDARILFRTKNKAKLKEGESGIVIPRTIIPLLKGEVDIQTSTDDAFGKCDLPGGISVYWRNIDGRYPNYAAVIPDIVSAQVVATLDKRQFLAMVNSGLAVCNKTTHKGELRFTEKESFELRVDNDFDVSNFYSGKLPAKYRTKIPEKGIVIGFNLRFLKAVISNTKDADVTFYLFEPNKGGIINEEFLIMPVMLNN
jgi:DNA polymerase III sliding clamp (beta) subunit (PCNA family)